MPFDQIDRRGTLLSTTHPPQNLGKRSPPPEREQWRRPHRPTTRRAWSRTRASTSTPAQPTRTLLPCLIWLSRPRTTRRVSRLEWSEMYVCVVWRDQGGGVARSPCVRQGGSFVRRRTGLTGTFGWHPDGPTGVGRRRGTGGCELIG